MYVCMYVCMRIPALSIKTSNLTLSLILNCIFSNLIKSLKRPGPHKGNAKDLCDSVKGGPHHPARMGDPKKKTKFDSLMYITYEQPAPAYPFYLVSFKFSDKDNSEKWKIQMP